MVECYVDVDVGTLYYAVRKLEKNGLIEAVAQERVARGGMRTIYRITDPAARNFATGCIGDSTRIEGPVVQTLYGALLFLHLADADVVKAALRRRIERLDELIAKLGPIREQLASKLSTGGDHLLGHIERQRRLDRAWLKDCCGHREERHPRRRRPG